MGGNRVGDGLAAAQAGGDELVGVAAVDLGAGGAAGGAAVAAAHEQVSCGEVGGVEVAEDLAGGGVDFGAVAVEADGLCASAQGGELADEGGEFPGGGEPGERGQCGTGRRVGGGCGGVVRVVNAGMAFLPYGEQPQRREDDKEGRKGREGW
ncbi:hypothetical protein GCM10020256_74430 [Streptomyces thermocoprophilus]